MKKNEKEQSEASSWGSGKLHWTLFTFLDVFYEHMSTSNISKDLNHITTRSRGFPLTPCCLSPQVECSCWTWGTPPACTASETLSELVPHDMPAWRRRQSSVMLWWSASSPSAPVGGSTEARWGKKRSICVYKCALFQGAGMGDLRFLKDVKGHFGECALLCEWRRSQERMKEKGSKATSGSYRESGKREEESDTFQEGKRKKGRGREGERLLCSLLEEEGILSRGVMSTTASIYTSHLHSNMTHSSQHPERQKQTDRQRQSRGGQVHRCSLEFDWQLVSVIAGVTQKVFLVCVVSVIRGSVAWSFRYSMGGGFVLVLLQSWVETRPWILPKRETLLTYFLTEREESAQGACCPSTPSSNTMRQKKTHFLLKF